MALKQYKLDFVSMITDKISRAQSMIVVDYCGMTVEQMTALRDKLREQNVEFKVVKNRLAKIALKEHGLNTMDEFLKGTKAIAFGIADPVSSAKVLVAATKDFEKLQIIGGQMEGALLSKDQVIELSKMPSREELLARLLGSLQSPTQKFACALNQCASKIAYALNAVATQKEEQGA